MFLDDIHDSPGDTNPLNINSIEQTSYGIHENHNNNNNLLNENTMRVEEEINVHNNIHNDARLSDEVHEIWRNESQFLFKWLVILNILLNSIEGVLPCMLPSISHRFNLSPTEQGMLGAFYYFTQALVSPLTDYVLQFKIATKYALIFAYIVNIGVLSIFNFLGDNSPHYSPILCMGALGIPSALITVICYVWINLFSNQSQKTSWTGMWQTTSVMGTVFGYATATFVTTWLPEKPDEPQTHLGWFLDYQLCILLIIILQTILCFYLWGIKSEHYDIKKAALRLQNNEQQDQNPPLLSIFSGKILIPFCSGVGSLSFLFFCVRGVNYWTTAYLNKNFPDQTEATIRLTFLSTAITAPALGLFLGSTIGYQIQKKTESIKQINFLNVLSASILGACAGVASIFAAFYHHFWIIVGSLWLLLFFGGASLPLISVTVLEILPPANRTKGTAIQNTATFIIGHGGALFIVGILYQYTTYDMAWEILLMTSWLSVICAIIMTFSLKLVNTESSYGPLLNS